MVCCLLRVTAHSSQYAMILCDGVGFTETTKHFEVISGAAGFQGTPAACVHTRNRGSVRVIRHTDRLKKSNCSFLPIKMPVFWRIFLAENKKCPRTHRPYKPVIFKHGLSIHQHFPFVNTFSNFFRFFFAFHFSANQSSGFYTAIFKPFAATFAPYFSLFRICYSVFNRF